MLINHKQTIRHAATMLLTISTAFLLTACGAGSGSDSESSKNDKAETEETSKSTTTTAAAPTPSTTTATSPTTATPAASSAGSLGKTAWANNCVACHSGDTGKGNNASKTMSAIASNTGGMGILKGKVSATDANNISAYTANPGAY